MKILLAVFAAMLLWACGGVEPLPQEEDVPVLPSVSAPRQWCGDGICDSDRGEDEWWCQDCGYSPLVNGPKDGGYCGDGVCFGGETMWTCFRDCRPVPMGNSQPPWDPNHIDPPPWSDNLDIPLPQGPLPPGPTPPIQYKQGPFVVPDRPDSY